MFSWLFRFALENAKVALREVGNQQMLNSSSPLIYSNEKESKLKINLFANRERERERGYRYRRSR